MATTPTPTPAKNRAIRACAGCRRCRTRSARGRGRPRAATRSCHHERESSGGPGLVVEFHVARVAERQPALRLKAGLDVMRDGRDRPAALAHPVRAGEDGAAKERLRLAVA